MKRAERVATLIAVAMLSIGVAGCGSSSSKSSGPSASHSGASGKVTTLQMWGRADDSTFLPALVKDFNASHPSIKIDLTLIPDADVAQKFGAAASSGSGPDIVSLDLATVPQYDTTGWLQNITAKAKALSYYGELSPAHLKLATTNGNLYALPFTADISVLYFNKTLFKQAGLDPNAPPTTMSQVLADAKTITARDKGDTGYYFSGACGGCMAFTALPYVYANGGNVLSGSAPHSTADVGPDNTALVETLGFFRDLWTSGFVESEAKTDSGANQFTAFFAGKVGMFVNGSYPLGELQAQKKIDFGVTEVPGEKAGEAGAYTGGDSIAITKAGASSAASWTALEWMTSTGQQDLVKLGVLPTRLDIASGEYAKAGAAQAVLAKALKIGDTPSATDVASVFYDNNSPWSELFQSAVFSGDITSAMKNGQSSMQDAMTR